MNGKLNITRKKSGYRYGASHKGEIAGGVLAVVGLFVVGLLLNLAVDAVLAGILMVLIGVLHTIIPAVPAFGFWACFLFVVILNFIRAVLTGGKS